MVNKTMEKFTNLYNVIRDNSIIGSYLAKNNKENYQNQYGQGAPLYIQIYIIILALVNVFICAWALYKATQCAEPICNFMIAVCAPHVYLVYRMAREKGPCLGKN
tara:strand:- start:386 stop:700 length:315 start_codon:yes stop_codon:yes gene_type:complete